MDIPRQGQAPRRRHVRSMLYLKNSPARRGIVAGLSQVFVPERGWVIQLVVANLGAQERSLVDQRGQGLSGKWDKPQRGSLPRLHKASVPLRQSPSWRSVNDEALHADNLPRVLAGMAFDRYCGSLSHGAIRWWQPEYFRVPSPAVVDAWFPPRDRSVRADCIDAYCASRRAEVAPLNREMRDAQVRLFALGRRIILVNAIDGTWRSADGANRGGDLIELGAWRWACRYGQAAHRIARLCGLRAVPTVAP